MAPITFLTLIINRFGIVFKSLGALSEKRIVSKPQVLSRLRYVDIVGHRNETPEELEYRTKYEVLQDWNNKYWAKNNELFSRKKDEYIKEKFGAAASKDEALSHDQLASFYCNFLEKNRRKHVMYNKIWYKNHLTLLICSINAKFSRIKANMS